MTTPTAGLTIFLGRFSFVLPADWAVAGREQKLYFSRATDDLRPRGPEVAGQSRTMQVLRGELPLTDPVIQEFTIDGVGAAAWFGLGDANSPDRRLVVLAGTPEGGVRIETLATVGREAQAEKAMHQLAAGYQPSVRTGFCLPQGAMTLPPSRNESTRLVATNVQRPSAELSFSTETMSVRRTDDKPTDLSAFAEALVGTDTTLKPLGKKKRQVAGLHGQEARAELREPRKPPALIYRFFFAGTPAQSTEPAITVALEGPIADKVMLDAVWNQFLDSVRPVPLH